MKQPSSPTNSLKKHLQSRQQIKKHLETLKLSPYFCAEFFADGPALSDVLHFVLTDTERTTLQATPRFRRLLREDGDVADT